MFNTGYMANVGVIPALVGRGDVVVSDALSHASIIDGCRLSRAEIARLPPRRPRRARGDPARGGARRHRRVLLAVDGVYSMDGDVAPLAEMRAAGPALGRHAAARRRARHRRARAPAAAAAAELLRRRGRVDVHLGTLGKSLGSFGAFVAGSFALRDLLVNVARSFIFSCALAPPQVEAARAALRLARREPWRRERAPEECRSACASGWRGTASRRRPARRTSCPSRIGDNDRTMAVCEGLLERGFYAQGIRYPSVPEGTRAAAPHADGDAHGDRDRRRSPTPSPRSSRARR